MKRSLQAFLIMLPFLVLVKSCGDNVENKYEYKKKKNRIVCINGWQWREIDGSLVEDYDNRRRQKRCSMEEIEIEKDRG